MPQFQEKASFQQIYSIAEVFLVLQAAKLISQILTEHKPIQQVW